MQTSIRFILDNRIVEIDFSLSQELKPTTTVLNYLRSLPDHKGVKEGCAEGDCGACTVVIGECGEHGQLVYKSIDSCLVFLPMVHGKQIITIENLAVVEQGEKKLHPVQQMMVEESGSQCGYCTPGIVMSLFGIYKNHNDPDKEIIQDALAGNLCRCTGYRSIQEATRKACSPGHSDHFSENEKNVYQLLQRILKDQKPLELNGSGQKYFKPFSLKDALRLRKDHPEAILINGSTDIALRQTKKNEGLSSIIDLSGVDELKHYQLAHNQILIGAGATLERVRQKTRDELPALSEICTYFGSLQIRNLATIGGNICSASPIGDTIPVLIAYRAKVIIQSLSGERILDLEDFIRGYRITDLKKDELLTGIIIPKPDKDTKVVSYKVSRRRDLDISTVSAAFRLKLQEKKIIEFIIVYGGMAEMTKRATGTESFLLGKEWTEEIVCNAGEVLDGEFNPISDARSEAGFRSKVARNLLLKFFHHIAGDNNLLH